MNSERLAKATFSVCLVLSVIGLAFGAGFYSAVDRNAVHDRIMGLVDDVRTVFQEAPVVTGQKPVHFLQPSTGSKDGVTVNKTNDDDLVLLSSFYDGSNEIRLMTRDGRVVNRWRPKFSEIFPHPEHMPEPPKTDWNIDLHGLVALPDGSVVFNFEYGGLVKMDWSGRVVWRLKRATHHSVEVTEEGAFWVPSRRYVAKGEASPIEFLSPPFNYDTLLKVSSSGRVLYEQPVHDIFFRNGLEPVLTSTGHMMHKGMDWDGELFHLNKIQPLKPRVAQAFPAFDSGAVLLSLRTYNMLLVYDPQTEEVDWWKIGPWLRQHDPEFAGNGTIVVFNNNCYVSESAQRGNSTIVAHNPATDDSGGVYGLEEGEDLFTMIRGKHELTSDGGLLISEFEGGRAFEVDAGGQIVWEYVNRYDDDEVVEISEARIYPREYFHDPLWQ